MQSGQMVCFATKELRVSANAPAGSVTVVCSISLAPLAARSQGTPARPRHARGNAEVSAALIVSGCSACLVAP